MANLLEKLMPREQLRSYGWAAAGGAVGAVGVSAIRPMVQGLPGVSTIAGVAGGTLLEGLLGLAAGRVLWNWNHDMAKGAVGAVAGSALVNALKSMGLPLGELVGSVFSAGPPGGPGAEELRDVQIDPEQLAEVEPSQEFAGLDARVEDVPPLGSFLSA